MGLTAEQIQAMIKQSMREDLDQFMAEVKSMFGSNAGKGFVPGFLNQQAYHQAEESAEDRKLFIARIARSMAAGKNDIERAGQWARKAYGETSTVAKALAAGEATAGGFIVPPGYRNEIIELLRPASVVRRMNPTIWPMPNGTAQVPKLTGGSTAAYVGENQNIGVTAPTFGQLNLSQKKLAAIVPISNDLIRYSSPEGDAVVRDDLVAAIAQREDLAFIRGDGLSDTPKGLRYWVPQSNPDNLIPANATVNLANVTTDLGLLVLALRSANVRMLRCGWLMSPRSWNYLMTVRDGNGNFAFRPEMLMGTLWGYPFAVTTQIPENLSTNKSEVYFVDFADAVIGESQMLIIDASGEAAYYDGSAVQAAFSRDQTVVRALEAHDFGMRHEASAACLVDVTWGV